MALGDLLKNLRATGAFLAGSPRDVKYVPRWLRERKAATMDLRQPWWPFAMTEYVESALPANAQVFEYGGGGSSLWLADGGAHTTIVEHDLDWGRRLQSVLPADQTEVLMIPPSESGLVSSAGGDGYFDEYVGAIDAYEDESFDLVVVDGRARVDCVLRAKPKVKRGGLLLLDDSDRPRYAAAIQALSSWPSKSVRGLKPGSPIPARTSVWTRVG